MRYPDPAALCTSLTDAIPEWRLKKRSVSLEAAPVVPLVVLCWRHCLMAG